MASHLGKYLFSEAGRDAPNQPGIYFICLGEAVRYDNGVSPLVYIGSSKNLRRRLRDHKKRSHNQPLIELLAKYHGLIFCDLFGFSLRDRDTLYAVEEAALRSFHQQYGTLPLFNFAVPPIPKNQRLKNPFQFGNPTVSRVVSPAEIAMTLFEVEVGRQEVSNEVVKIDESGKAVIAQEGDRFNAFRFPSSWQVSREKEEKRRSLLSPEERQDEDENKLLKIIQHQHTLLWTTETYFNLLNICGELTEMGVSSKRIRKFKTPCSDIAKPYTWGEVAVAMIGRLSGTLRSKDEKIVKIVFGRELLGTARISNSILYATDETVAPQRLTLRKHPMDGLKHSDLRIGWISELEEIAESNFQAALDQFRSRRGQAR